MAARRLLGIAMATVAALVLSSCTYADREPGLFGTRAPSAPAPLPTTFVPEPVNPELPVVGTRVWTTAEGIRVTVRFAVHAVRRIAGATVLDWSVTALGAPGYGPGDTLPSGVDLGLGREEAGTLGINLIDPAAGRVYHPLAHRSRERFLHCLCTPLWIPQMRLRVGETQLLQVAFPALPPGLTRVDVDFSNSAPFAGVTVTPEGSMPLPTAPVDLNQPAPPADPASAPHRYRPPGGSVDTLILQVDRVTRLPASTSLQWSVRSLTGHDLSSLAYGPPLAVDLSARIEVTTTAAADSPRLRPAGRPADDASRVRWVTVPQAGRDAYACLCSEVGLWAGSLRRRGGVASLAATYAPLPPTVTRVDVTVPGVATFRDVPVSEPETAALGAARALVRPDATWTYDETDPPRSWRTADWPTPLPDPGQLTSYASVPGQIVAWPH
ncbi:MAG: hypothetical protein JWP61_1417 [Friedmanniella sp.]|nr:hypothetical protein [Friedmanniella sp.]